MKRILSRSSQASFCWFLIKSLLRNEKDSVQGLSCFISMGFAQLACISLGMPILSKQSQIYIVRKSNAFYQKQHISLGKSKLLNQKFVFPHENQYFWGKSLHFLKKINTFEQKAYISLWKHILLSKKLVFPYENKYFCLKSLYFLMKTNTFELKVCISKWKHILLVKKHVFPKENQYKPK